MLRVCGKVSRPRPLDRIHLILPPIGLLRSTNIGTLGQLSVLDFVCISSTLLLSDLQKFCLLNLLGGLAFGSAKSQGHL